MTAPAAIVAPVRWLGFVVLTTSIVTAYCTLAGCALPPLRNESASLLVLPMAVISGAVASAFYPALAHRETRSSRVIVMYGAFVLALVVYGVYLWMVIPGGTITLIVTALVLGHLYGVPAFLLVVLASSIMGRVLFSERATIRG